MDDAERKAREIVKGLKLKERLPAEGNVYVAEAFSTALREARQAGMMEALNVAREYEKGRYSRGDWNGEICARAVADAIERAAKEK